MINDKKIGLALGGGGARGIAHIGVLNVLIEERIEPDYVVGCSMGAIIGAYYCLGLDLLEAEKEIKSFNKKKAIKELFDIKMKSGLLGGKKAYKYLKKMLHDKSFDDLNKPFKTIATNLASGEEKIISEGDLVTAIQASMSVPGVFPPVEIDGQYYIDGGVSNPTPTDVVKNMGADVIIGVDLVMARDIEIKNPNILNTIMQSYDIMRTQSIKSRLTFADKETILIKPDMRSLIEGFKFFKMEEFIKSGEEATRKQLPLIKKRLGMI